MFRLLENVFAKLPPPTLHDLIISPHVFAHKNFPINLPKQFAPQCKAFLGFLKKKVSPYFGRGGRGEETL